MRPWITLLRMEMRALSREGWLLATLILTPLTAGMAPLLVGLPAMYSDALEAAGAPAPEKSKNVVLCVEGDPGLPTAAFVGPPPPWLSWPGGWADPATADVLIDPVPGDPPTFRVMALSDDADLREADDCVWDAIYTERARRLESIGISERPGIVTHLTMMVPPVPTRLPELGSVPVLAITGLVSVVMFGAGVLLDLLPRRRRTGLLEMIRGTRATGLDLVISALALALLATLLGQLLMLTGLGVSSAVMGTLQAPGPLPLALVPVWLGLLTSGLALFKGVRDLRAAALSLMALMVVWALIAGVAGSLLSSQPTVAAAVPIGGALLALFGLLSPAGTVLAGAVTTVSSVVLALWTARALDAEEHAGGQLDPTLLRRAHGHFGLEILLLCVLGTAGTGLIQVGLSDHPWPGIIASQVLFMLLPALLAPVALGLPVRELLPLGRLRPAEALAAPGVALGLIGAATLAAIGSAAVLPGNPALLEQFGEGMMSLTSGPGLLLIGLVPAICEEALFRGAIQGLLLRGRSPVVAIVVQAVLFALFHVFPFRWAPTFVSGLALGWLRWRTGSLWAGALVHLSVNCGMVLMIRFGLAPTSPKILGPMLLGLGFLWLYRHKMPRKGEG